MTYVHLKDEAYYSELYDRGTVETCRRREAAGEKEYGEVKTKSDKAQKIEELKHKLKVTLVMPMALHFYMGERYADKAATIREWMSRDRMKDAQVADAEEPRNIRCIGCGSFMNCTTRDLHSDLHDKERILFFFECPKCQKRQVLWEGGEKWESRPDPCPKCKTDMGSKYTKKDNVITTTLSCPACAYEEIETMDLNKKREEPVDLNFEADRKKYCMSEKDGMSYVVGRDRMKHAVDMMMDRQKNSAVYDAVSKLKKLTIVELQNLLNPIIEKADYVKFEFGKPEVQRDVILSFTLQDNKPGRPERDSVLGLQKLLKTAVEGTNWRLMSEGVSYRLGFMEGRLRGVSGEESLKELVKTPEEPIK